MKVKPKTEMEQLGTLDFSVKNLTQISGDNDVEDGHVDYTDTGDGRQQTECESETVVESSDKTAEKMDENESDDGLEGDNRSNGQNEMESEDTVETETCIDNEMTTDNIENETKDNGESEMPLAPSTSAWPQQPTSESPIRNDSPQKSSSKSPKFSDSVHKSKTTSPSVSDGLILVPTTDHPLANLDHSVSLEDSDELDKPEPPKKEKRRVRFHENESQSCVLSYHDPPDPWQNSSTFTSSELVQAYKQACINNSLRPIPRLVSQLEATADVGERYETLTLKGERLDRKHCDALESILRRVQFKTIDLEATDLDDDSAGCIFDMVEFYDSATRLVISYNKAIGPRGWQACARMMKRTPSLTHLDVRNCSITDHSMPFLGRALRIGSLLQVLHLENCGVSGKVLLILVAALKLNDHLRELYLADNRLMPSDGIQLGNLLKHNDRLQLLDLRNNHLQDTGNNHICEGLEVHDQKGWGLTTLVLWNNQITQNSMNKLAACLSVNKTVETLNLGHNNLGNEGVLLLKEGLLKNLSLKRLGLQCCRLFCEGAIAVAELIADSQRLLRVDLRENEIKTAGLMALSLSLKMNQSVTRLDLDKEPKKERAVKDYLEQQVNLMSDISNWLQRNRELAYCLEQAQNSESSESSPEKEETESAEENIEDKTVTIEENTDLSNEKEEEVINTSRPKRNLLFNSENRAESLESPMVASDVTISITNLEHVAGTSGKTDHVPDYSNRSKKRGGGRMFSVKYVPENSLVDSGLSIITPNDAIVSPTLEFPLSLNPAVDPVLPVLVPVDIGQPLPQLLPVDLESNLLIAEMETETSSGDDVVVASVSAEFSKITQSDDESTERPGNENVTVQSTDEQSAPCIGHDEPNSSDTSRNVIEQCDAKLSDS